MQDSTTETVETRRPFFTDPRVIVVSTCFIFLAYLFVVFDVNFQGPDQPVYYAYTVSIVENGDLNAVDQMNVSGGRFVVTGTYNHPDYHNHGGIVFWAPFYLYGKLSYALAGKIFPDIRSRYGEERVIRCALSFSTVFFTVLTLLLTYLFCAGFFSKRLSLLSTIAVFFGTPFFDCAIFETGNANIIALPFAVVSLWLCMYAAELRRRDWLLYGLFFSMCLVLKSEIAFQLVLVGSLFVLSFRVRGKKAWIDGLFFSAGLLPGFALRLINDSLKYGSLHIGEAGLFSFRNFYFFEQIFSSYRGFFYTSPLFYLCLLGFCFLALAVRRGGGRGLTRQEGLFLVLAGLYLFIKIFLLSFRYAWGGGTPGARILLTEVPIIAALYAGAFLLRQRSAGRLFIVCSALFVSWNIITVYEYYRGMDMSYLTQAPALTARIKMLPQAFGALFRMRDIDLKTYFCLPLLAAGAGCILYLTQKAVAVPSFSPHHAVPARAGRMTFLRAVGALTAFLYLSYGTVTLFNCRNNQRNVERLTRSGFFQNASIIEKKDYERRENIGSLEEMISYYSARGDAPRVERIKRLQKELYNE